MNNIVKVTIKLLLITIVAGALLGAVYSVTKEPIAQQMEKAATEARLAAFPDAADFEEYGADIPNEYSIIKNVFYAKDSGGNIIGATFGITTKGYNAGLNLTVGISADGTVKRVVIGDNSETPGLGKKAEKPSELSDKFSGKPIDKPFQMVKAASGEYDIEAIAGATVTSKAITNAVNTAAEFYKQMAGGVK